MQKLCVVLWVSKEFVGSELGQTTPHGVNSSILSGVFQYPWNQDLGVVEKGLPQFDLFLGVVWCGVVGDCDGEFGVTVEFEIAVRRGSDH